MYIDNKWYTEPELNSYIKELNAKISELEDKHWNECRQITHYENELKEAKRLLKSAIDEWNYDCEYGECKNCINWQDEQCTQGWSGKADALKLIGDEGND